MKKPNILLITTDQQRFDTLHCAGYDHMITPNLDALADEGCLFTNAYSPNPVCIPARHNLLTGLTAKYHGFDDNYFDESKSIPYDLPTFAEILQDDRYNTVAIGKMHFQPYRAHNGFNRLLLMDEIPRFLEDDDYALYLREKGYTHLQSVHGVRHMLYMQPQESLVKEEDHGTTWVANKTIETLDTISLERPFLIWSGFIAPHPPFDVPKEYQDIYRDKEIPTSKESKTSLSNLALENMNIADYPNESYLRRAKECYYSTITHVDTHIGRIIQKLKEIGEYDNTLIIFTSDHGEMLGDYGTYQKFLPYDSSSRVPLIVRYPRRIAPHTIDNRLVSLNDILPTMMDAAGLKYPGAIKLPGQSLLEKHTGKDEVFMEHCRGNRRWVTICTQEFKYNYYFSLGREELFDRINDPNETTNLLEVKPEQYESIRNNLNQRLVNYEMEYGLPNTIEDGKFVKLDEMKINFYREANPPIFPKMLRNKNEQFWELKKELVEAIKNEDVIHLDELDTDYYVKQGVFTQEDIEEMKQQRLHKNAK